MREVWVKCPFNSWTAITSNPAAHGGFSWYQSSASETSCPSAACVMGTGQTAPFLSPSCSRLSLPAPFLSASSSTFCCHTSGFEHGATSWIWSLAAVCCQCFPTEDRDGIQKARGNGGQAGKVHSRWRLRQNRISTGAMSVSLLSTQLLECLPLQHVSPVHFSIISENVDCLLHLLYLWMSSLWMQTSTAGCVTNMDHWEHIPMDTAKKVHGWKMTHPAQTIRIEAFLSFAQWQMPTRRSWRIQSMQLLLLVWAGIFQGLWSANNSEWGLKKRGHGAWKCTLCVMW